MSSLEVRLPWACPLALMCALCVAGCGPVEEKPAASSQFVPVDEEESSIPVKERTPSAVDPAAPTGEVTPPRTNPAGTQSSGKSTVGNDDPAPKTVVRQPPASKTESTNKGATKAPAAGKSEDLALTGPTKDKVRLLRSATKSLGNRPRTNAQLQALQEQIAQVLQVAEEILAEENAPDAARDEALFARFQASAILANYDLDKDAGKMLAAAAEELSHAKDAKFATMGRVQMFMSHVGEIMAGKPRDAKQVVEGLETLLKAGGDVDILGSMTVNVAQQLESAGYLEDSIAAMEVIAEHFGQEKGEKAQMMAGQVKLLVSMGRIRLGKDVEQAGKDLVENARQLAEDSQADPGIFQLLQQFAMQFEGEQPEIATGLYGVIQESYANHSEERVAEVATKTVANGKKRLALIGKPLTVTGVDMKSGEPLDWSKYQGKIVLVDFWATWCKPCLDEMSNISKNYKQYHDQGFEVIGVNLDDEVATVEEFFNIRPLAWTTVIGASEEERGFNHPMAQKCGIDAIPFVVLIGRDGKVAGIHVRGPRLENALKEMLGGEKPESDQPTDPAGESPATEPSESDERPATDDKPDEASAADEQPDGPPESAK